MFHHGLDGMFGFVFFTGKKEEYLLLIKVISIVVEFLLSTVCVKLLELSLFIFIMFNLPVEIESGALLIEAGLLLLLWVRNILLLGKNLYARLSSASGYNL